MCHYTHFTTEERESLLVLRKNRKTITEIAKELNRSKSTISRELKRNSVKGVYSACAADAAYKSRRKRCKRHKLLENKELKSVTEQYTVVYTAACLKHINCHIKNEESYASSVIKVRDARKQVKLKLEGRSSSAIQ